MKKIILIATSAALLLAACNSKKSDTQDQNAAKVTYADTVGFAAFQQWKMQNELQNSPASNTQPQQAAPTQEKVVYRTVYKDRPSYSSGKSSGSSSSTSSSGTSRSTSGTGTTYPTQ